MRESPRRPGGAGPGRRPHRLQQPRVARSRATALGRVRLRRIGIDRGGGASSSRSRPAREQSARRAFCISSGLPWWRMHPARIRPPTALPVVPAPIAYAAQQFVNALPQCAVYALLATAYALIYGLIGRLNLAFGEIAVIGAFGAIGGLAAGLALGLEDPIGGLALAFTVSVGLAPPLELVRRPRRHRADTRPVGSPRGTGDPGRHRRACRRHPGIPAAVSGGAGALAAATVRDADCARAGRPFRA